MRLELNLALILMLLFATSQAATISVPGDYSSIQAAIDAAEDGDVIEVESGIYRENVNVDKSLTLRGLGMPTVDAGGKGSAITLSTDGISLEGFIAMNSSNVVWDGGIEVKSKDNIVRDNNVSHNDNGIVLYSCSNNTIMANNATYNDDGICLYSSTKNTIMINNANNNNDTGISLHFSSNNNTVEGNNACYNNHGISVGYSSNDNTIEGNNALDNDYRGIALSSSDNNIMRDNNMSGNRYNFEADGYNDIDTSNLADGKPIYYMVGAFDAIIDSSSNAAIVYCIDCENITVNGLTFRNNGYGIIFNNTSNSKIVDNNFSGFYHRPSIRIINSSNNTIEGNNAIDNYDGISLMNSRNNIIEGNNASWNDRGIWLSSSSNNTIEGNNAHDNAFEGIYLSKSSNNILKGNSVDHNELGGICLLESSSNIIRDSNACYNGYGILLGYSDNNIISENNASYNEKAGIDLLESQDNAIYSNSLVDNVIVDAVDNGVNQWDDGAAGNYYSEFNCIDSNDDGICDSVYRIFGGESIDRYPLATPPT